MHLVLIFCGVIYTAMKYSKLKIEANDDDYQGGDPEKVRENQRKRFKDPTSVDKIIELDNSWRQARYLLVMFVWYLLEIFAWYLVFSSSD